MTSRTDLGRLTLPFERIETIHLGGTQVRRYRNELTGLDEVGKRFDTLGVETAVAVQEGAWLQRIRHPNLVPVFSVAEVVDGPNSDIVAMRPIVEITMPYYPRGSVCDAFARGRSFNMSEARDITLGALRGLGELHCVHRILHRDVKTPDLFLMESDGPSTARLGDLGAAAQMDADGRAEGINAPQLWTPPENYTAGRLTVRSDIYSMGVVLYELLHGPLPYGDYDRAVMLQRLNQGRPAFFPRNFQMRPEIPRALRQVVRKATRRTPDERYASTRSFARAVASAPVIDWERDDGEYEVLWRGVAADAARTRFRVRANYRPRLRAWRLKAERRYPSSWRRVQDDVDVDGLLGPDTSAVFDALTDSLAR